MYGCRVGDNIVIAFPVAEAKRCSTISERDKNHFRKQVLTQASRLYLEEQR